MRPYIRERVVDLLTRIDSDLARSVAEGLGIALSEEQLSRELPKPVNGLDKDPSLSLVRQRATRSSNPAGRHCWWPTA